NQITLSINKRLKNEKDRNTLKKLKEDLFNLDVDVIDTIKKYKFKTVDNMSDVKTIRNICYFVYRTDMVNKHIHNNIIDRKDKKTIKIKGVDYWVGLELLCRKSYIKGGVRLYVNYTYKIVSINKKSFTIIEEFEGTTMTFDIDMLSHFKLNYSNTVHSVQG